MLKGLVEFHKPSAGIQKGRKLQQVRLDSRYLPAALKDYSAQNALNMPNTIYMSKATPVGYLELAWLNHFCDFFVGNMS